MKQNTLYRIKIYIDSKGVSTRAFEASVGISNGAFASQLKNNKTIGVDKIENILHQYPDINPSWLLTGEGEMIRTKSKRDSVDFSMGTPKGIPLIPIGALAGRGEGELVIRDSDIEERYVVPEFSKADFLIRVKGSSMYPKYSSGDVVACIKLPKNSFIQWNKTYVINTVQGVMIKRIVKGATKKEWILRSDNKDYEDIEVLPETDVYSIALVIGVIRFE